MEKINKNTRFECTFSADFVVSGGADGCVRVWHPFTRELLGNFTDHKRPVTHVTFDISKPHLLHSTSEDRQTVTFDLKQGRATVKHVNTFSKGTLTGLSQRKGRTKPK